MTYEGKGSSTVGLDEGPADLQNFKAIQQRDDRLFCFLSTPFHRLDKSWHGDGTV